MSILTFPSTRKLLDVDSLQQDLNLLVSQGPAALRQRRSKSTKTRSQLTKKDDDAHESTDSTPKKSEITQMKKALLSVSDELDERLQSAIQGNNSNFYIRLLLLAVLAILIPTTICIAIIRDQPAIGVVGSVVPTGLITWLLRTLRQLQDERIGLVMRVARFRPLIVSCVAIPCLRQTAVQISEELRQLDPTTPENQSLLDAVTAPNQD